VKDKELYNQLTILYRDGVAEAKESATRGLRQLQEAVARLSIDHSSARDIDAAATAEESYAYYEKSKHAGGVTGLHFPWDHANKVTQGMHGGQYIAYYAQAKRYKSWLLTKSFVHLHREHGKIPMVVTREMPAADLRNRAVVTYAGVDWTAYRQGKLTPADEKQLKRATEEMRDGPPLPIVEIPANGLEGVAELRAKIEEHEPDIVFFDGIYLLAVDGGDWQSMSAVNKAVKQLALQFNIPIVGTAQENEQGRITHKTFQTDCDLLINIVQEDEHRAQREVVLEFPYFRDGIATPFSVHARPAINLSQKSVIAAVTPEDAIKEDDEPDTVILADEDDPKPAHVGRGGRVKA
jgi:replicative DNA helicase